MEYAAAHDRSSPDGGSPTLEDVRYPRGKNLPELDSCATSVGLGHRSLRARYLQTRASDLTIRRSAVWLQMRTPLNPGVA